jgi:hypothetical protein
MIDPPASPGLYRVDYSGRVKDELGVLLNRAAASGFAGPVVAALTTLDYRLPVFPQFGDPLQEIAIEPGHHRIAVVPPLVARYLIYEERRLVIVVTPIQTPPNAGF